MTRIRVSTVIEAPAEVVWAVLEDVGSHVEWMDDAVAIRFVSAQRRGPGTAFECDTKVGPFRLTDRMQITSWKPGRVMGVRHVGLVTGEGTFRLRRLRGNRTRFTWTERLRFPWWMAGPAGGLVGGRLLKRIWRRNLENLRSRVEI